MEADSFPALAKDDVGVRNHESFLSHNLTFQPLNENSRSAQQVDASETRARKRLLRGHPSTFTRPSPADPLRWADRISTTGNK